MKLLFLLICLFSALPCLGQQRAPSSANSTDNPPPIPREFRAAWCAIVYNIDWPSRAGLPAATQQAELVAILDTMASLHMNALIFQVRPESDAAYAGSTEPWSAWLTGKMGNHPGYDPLAFCLREAHQRGIEVHAWFNPFRALANASKPAAATHISRTHPQLTTRYADSLWCDPSHAATRQRALAAMHDVAKRYPVDGIHIDDYFYPYPKNGQAFPDGKTTVQRRAIVDAFVSEMYSSIKKIKPTLRVGISPFGIWQPGVPTGTTAQLNAYEDLACDARKWLAKGWCDYMAPQLYWRIDGPQSYSLLLPWWRSQGTRPVWPGIATSRIKSTDDPSRPASEIIQQIDFSRSKTPAASYPHGHIHWSVKAIMKNTDGIATKLRALYPSPALPPPMPWSGTATPPPITFQVQRQSSNMLIHLGKTDPTITKIVIQTRSKGQWKTEKITNPQSFPISIPAADAIALTPVNAFGHSGTPQVKLLNK